MPPKDADDESLIAATRLLAETELRARQAAAAEAALRYQEQAATHLKRLADLGDAIREPLLAWLASPGLIGFLRYVYDGTPTWTRAIVTILFSLSLLGMSSSEILEVLHVLFPALPGGSGAPSAVPGGGAGS